MKIDHQEKYGLCIDACDKCALACNHCVAACLGEDDVKMMASCIAMDIDCAAVCQLASAAMARGSIHAGAICKLCAEICKACGEECDAHKAEHCQACAKACRACADACIKMVN